MKRRLALIFIAVPCVAFLMLCDALVAAWDELAGDWRSTKSWFMDEWRGE